MNYVSGIKMDSSPTGNMDCDTGFQEKQDQMPQLPFTCTGNPGRNIQYTHHIGSSRFNYILTPLNFTFFSISSPCVGLKPCGALSLQGTNLEEHFSPLLNLTCLNISLKKRQNRGYSGR